MGVFKSLRIFGILLLLGVTSALGTGASTDWNQHLLNQNLGMAIHGDRNLNANDPSLLNPEDIFSNSKVCQQLQNDDVRCEYNAEMKRQMTGVFNVISGDLMQDFGKQLQSDQFVEVMSAFRSQFAAATFFGGANPLQLKGGIKNRLVAELGNLSKSCGEKYSESLDLYTKGLEVTNGKHELGVEGLSEKVQSQLQDTVQRRMLVAFLEHRRLKSLLNGNQQLSDEEKKTFLHQIQRIHETYPMINDSLDIGSFLTEYVEAHYHLEKSFNYKARGHADIDTILFLQEQPDGTNRYDIPNTSTSERELARSPITGLYNRLLTEDLPEEVIASLQKTLSISMIRNLQSIARFCGMNTCQSIQLSPNSAAGYLNQLPEASRAAIHRGICECEVNRRSEYVGLGPQLAAGAMMIGGFVACPFTVGVGCAVGTVSAAALTTMGAVNTMGAAKDTLRNLPVLQVARGLPGLSEAERANIDQLAMDAHARLMFGATELASTGLVVGGNAVKALRRLNDTARYNPLALHNNIVSGEQVVDAVTETKAWLRHLYPGVDFPPDTHKTVLKRVIEDKTFDGELQVLNIEKTGMGQTFQIRQLPTPNPSATWDSPFMSHPEFAGELKKLREMGYDVVIDPTLDVIGLGGRADDLQKIIHMPAHGSWEIFLHEVQHVEFDHIFGQRGFDFARSLIVGKNGKKTSMSLVDMLHPRELQMLGMQRVATIEQMMLKGHTKIGIDETLSVQAQLRAMGWRPFVFKDPTVSRAGYETFTYGAHHRATELAKLPNRTLTQTREMYTARLQATMAGVLQQPKPVRRIGIGVGAGVGAPIVLGGSAYAGYSFLYHPKNQEVIGVDPNGRFFRFPWKP